MGMPLERQYPDPSRGRKQDWRRGWTPQETDQRRRRWRTALLRDRVQETASAKGTALLPAQPPPPPQPAQCHTASKGDVSLETLGGAVN